MLDRHSKNRLTDERSIGLQELHVAGQFEMRSAGKPLTGPTPPVQQGAPLVRPQFEK
jgi:hypothetical protein